MQRSWLRTRRLRPHPFTGHPHSTRGSGAVWCSRALAFVVLAVAALAGCGPEEPAGPTGEWAMVSAGREFTCGIRLDGSLACWGEEGFKGLDIDDNTDAGQVSDAPTEGEWTWVATGDATACAVRAGDGSIECWGYSGGGEYPVPGTDWVKAVTSTGITCALDVEGRVSCWGDQWEDLHGCDSPNLEGTYIDIDVSDPNLVLLRDDGSIEAPCPNWYFDDGWTYEEWDLPESAIFVEVSSGRYRSCARSQEGTAWCWDTSMGGPEERKPHQGTYTSISTDSHIGDDVVCAVLSSGGVDCWGSEDGIPPIPESVADLVLVQVSVGDGHVCALTDNHDIVCWGDDFYGQATPPSEGE
jgi:alpha-tubulin suppressor-like RCC1 family protein